MAKINKPPPRIALLATGDEIIHGDITNSDGQYAAQQLIDHNLQPGTHMTVPDDKALIKQAILYLLQDHAALITIGGLGPTSDDLTRFGLASALNQSLVFDEPSWQKIVERLTSLGLNVPDNNRQQCLFPENADIIPNPHGTAAACCVFWQKKPIFMLPGPPREFKPLFDSIVIPKLIEFNFAQTVYRQSWLLLGIGEGNLAKKIDQYADDENCQIGYRVCFPYIELKLSSHDKKSLQKIVNIIANEIDEYIVSTEKQTASQQLYNFIKDSNLMFTIDDQATYGLFSNQLLSPSTIHQIKLNPENADQQMIKIQLSGLTNYWQKADVNFDEISITIEQASGTATATKKIPLRGRLTLELACEIACQEILKELASSSAKAGGSRKNLAS